MFTVDVALKEWQAVCDLLAEGSQILLLRKGGIQEGPGGFEIAHRRFALLPTRLHQDPAMLKPEHRARIAGGEVEPTTFPLTHAGEITDILTVPSRAALDRLDELHPWAEPYLEMRWNYRPERPLFLLLVRAYALTEPAELKNTYKVAGCRSWVPLGESGIEPLAPAEPVLADDAYTARRASVLARLQ